MFEMNSLRKYSLKSKSSSQSNLLAPTLEAPKKLSVLVAALFIAGNLAGVGILALPYAVEQTGWIGIVLIILFGATAAYTGDILGQAWNLVETRYNIDGHVQDPYPILGEKSFGRTGRLIVQISSYTGIFGGCTIFLLMAAELTSNIIKELGGGSFSPCYMTLIIGVILIPLSWLGTPIDFWPLGVAALVSTTFASVLISAYTIYLRHDDLSTVTHKPIEVEGFFLALGAIAFTYAGHPTFPTIQQDMEDKSKFGQAIAISFSGVINIYLLITITTYLFIGDLSTTNILTTLSNIEPGWPVTFSEILLLIHLVTSFLVVLNPLSQDFEQFFNIKNKFGCLRTLVRTMVVMSIIFTAETIPRFGVLVALVGGTAVTMIIFVLPVAMYDRLCRQRGDWEYIGIRCYQTALHSIILIVSLILIVASTYGGLQEIVGPDSFVPPCYVNISAARF